MMESQTGATWWNNSLTVASDWDQLPPLQRHGTVVVVVVVFVVFVVPFGWSASETILRLRMASSWPLCSYRLQLHWPSAVRRR